MLLPGAGCAQAAATILADHLRRCRLGRKAFAHAPLRSHPQLMRDRLITHPCNPDLCERRAYLAKAAVVVVVLVVLEGRVDHVLGLARRPAALLCSMQRVSVLAGARAVVLCRLAMLAVLALAANGRRQCPTAAGSSMRMHMPCPPYACSCRVTGARQQLQRAWPWVHCPWGRWETCQPAGRGPACMLVLNVT